VAGTGEWGKEEPQHSESAVHKPRETSAGLWVSWKAAKKNKIIEKKNKVCGDLMTEQWMLQYKYIQVSAVTAVTP